MQHATMRPDIGLHTIPQRIAAIASLRSTPPSGAAPAGGDVAATLQTQLDAQGSPAGAPAAGAATYAGFQRPVGLGAGVSLTSTPGLISPALPGAGTGTAVAGVAPVGASGRTTSGPLALDRSGPPPELQAYGNGQIPSAALASVGVGDHTLWEPAARAFRDMVAAAARDGVSFGVNSSYRDLAGQQAMVDRYGLYSQGGRAAAPGSSNHGWGLSIDLDLDDRAQAWMREHGATYGFVEDVAREPWHWTFKASAY
ncbi:D-alanyl-D-alanine carboxypeptidase family protein [Euzebya sp.]|uniref:M15 family metallopeptidase n=1 Tax=Euzebya sp. TaxID=1971409 RepID=UPI003513B0BD